MVIQNVRDISYAKLKTGNRKTTNLTSKCVSVHDAIVSYSARYNETLIDWLFR